MYANWPTRVHAHVFPGSALWPCGKNADSSAGAPSARRPGVLAPSPLLPFSPFPTAWPNRSRRQNRQTIPSPASYAGIAGLGTGYTEEEDWKDQAPIRSGLSPQMDPLESGKRTRSESARRFGDRVGYSLFPALDRCKTTDSKPRERAEKHRIRWRQQDLALDLTHRGPLSLCQTKSSPVSGLG